jgi:outer membrane protein
MRKLNKVSLVLALLVTSAFSSIAQTKLSSSLNGQPFTLRECVDYALKNNPSILLNELAVENGFVQLNQSRMNKLPIANGQMGLNGNAGRNIDPFTNGIVTQTIGTNSMGLGASVPIYDASRNKNTIERNKLNIEAAQMDVNAIKNSVSLQVALAYLNVLSTEDLIEVSQKQLEVTRLQLERTQKLVNAGTLAETNLFDLDAQLANDELALVNAQNNNESALLTLKQAMNAPNDLEIRPTRITLADPNLEQYAASPTQVYNTALGYLPEIKAGEIRLRLSDRNIAIAKSLGLPSLSASTSWGTAFSSVAKRIASTSTTNNPLPVSAEFQGQTIPFVINFPQTQVVTEGIPYFRQLGNNQNLNVGLALRIPIFNGYNQKYQTQLAQIQKKQVDLQNQNAKLQIKQNIDQAYINMLNAQKRYSATMQQVLALEKSFKAVENRYNAGSGNFVDYNLSKTNLDRAKTNLIVAKYDYVFRMKVLDFYQNKPLEL